MSSQTDTKLFRCDENLSSCVNGFFFVRLSIIAKIQFNFEEIKEKIFIRLSDENFVSGIIKEETDKLLKILTLFFFLFKLYYVICILDVVKESNLFYCLKVMEIS